MCVQPYRSNYVDEEILNCTGAMLRHYCIEGKTEEKILREFTNLGNVQVKQVVHSLAKQGKLKIVNKGPRVLYQAAR